MQPIGFSTGALAKGDFATGLEVQRRVARIDAVELSALRDYELPDLVDAIPNLNLDGFDYVSFHAPSKLQTLDEYTVFDLLLGIPDSWPIVVHPELLQTPSLWRELGDRLCLENMDNRKTTGSCTRSSMHSLKRRSVLTSATHARSIRRWRRRCACFKSSAAGFGSSMSAKSAREASICRLEQPRARCLPASFTWSLPTVR
jgi:hypothetical protein